MNDQKEVNLALRVAIEAAKSHNECAPKVCGGSRLDPCALGNALDDLTSYQRSAGYIATEKRGYMSDDCMNCAPLLAGASLTRADGTDQRDGCGRCGFQGAPAPDIWVLRTWVDVRVGDVVCMPGQDATAAEVMELVTLGWHVNDIPPAGATPEQAAAFARDVQYRPNEHAGEWTARPVTLRPLADDPATRHRIPNVNPAAPVEIRCTQVEIDAIELLGGWANRLDTRESSAQ